MSAEFTNAFNQLRQDVETISLEQTNSQSQVIAIDMFTGFNDNFLADEVHYNQAGAEFIASRYYNILENILE